MVLRLSDEQLAVLGADARARYQARLVARLAAQHPELASSAPARVAERVDRALAAGVSDEASVTRYTSTTFAFDPIPAPPPPPVERSLRERRRDRENPSSRTVGSAVQSCLTYLDFTLVDEDGDPVPNEPFVVELPDGTKKSGLTDGAGQAYLEAIPKGTCKVTFPSAEVKKK